jgi:DNA primase
MSFDALRFLEEFDIPHRTQGQKTTKGWVQIRECPFCYGDGYYLGVSLQGDSHFHCWFCNKGGKIEFLISKLLKIGFKQAKKITAEYGGAIDFDEPEDKSLASEVKITGMANLQPIHINYLSKRGYDHSFLERRYQIGGCYTVGRFPYRIVIPVYDNSRLVSATSRDVTGQQTERYMSLRNDESVIPIKDCVYNIDSVTKENILIVEGPFDVWRVGGATVSFFGTEFSMKQVMRVLSKAPKNVYIIFDNEPKAQEHANELASCFSPLVHHVEVIEIPFKDPAMMSSEEAMNVKNELDL